jgi:hypothetical protein
MKAIRQAVAGSDTHRHDRAEGAVSDAGDSGELAEERHHYDGAEPDQGAARERLARHEVCGNRWIHGEAPSEVRSECALPRFLNGLYISAC